MLLFTNFKLSDHFEFIVFFLIDLNIFLRSVSVWIWDGFLHFVFDFVFAFRLRHGGSSIRSVGRRRPLRPRLQLRRYSLRPPIFLKLLPMKQFNVLVPVIELFHKGLRDKQSFFKLLHAHIVEVAQE